MTCLPAEVCAYKTTPVFKADTVPKALTRSHRTKPGVWGRITVLTGALDLTRFDADGAVIRHDAIWSGEAAIVAPGEPHAVTLSDSASFQVTFLRAKPAHPIYERV